MSTSNAAQVVWQNKLDGRYDVSVERLDGQRGELVVMDGDKELLREVVGLFCGALYGIDASDVSAWEDRCAVFVDGLASCPSVGAT